MKQKYLVPSLEIESRSNAFNIGIWAINGLASNFTFWSVVIILPMAFYGILDLLGNMTMAWGYVSIFGLLLTNIANIFFAIIAINRLLISYRLEEDKIVKGLLISGPNIFKRIECNAQLPFVEMHFDQKFYKKKEYLNPILIKETPKKLVYKCDNTKLTIYKMYSNMDIELPLKKSKSFMKRLVKTLILTFILGIIVSFAVIGVEFMDTQNYISEIKPIEQQQLNEITENLKKYNYTLDDYQNKFVKDNAESGDCEVRYIFNKYTAEIVDIDVNLRIPVNYNDIYSEFDDIIAPIVSKFHMEDINNFKNGISDIIAGNFAIETLESIDSKITIRLKQSDGEIYIYTN